jgi:hypothetical protein
MKKRLAGIFTAGAVLAALGVSFASPAPAEEISAALSRAGAAASAAAARSEKTPALRAPASKPEPFVFGPSIPVTPPSSGLEDCFNDPIPASSPPRT